MVFTYNTTRQAYGTFEQHKKVLQSQEWFPQVKTYLGLPRWWHNFGKTINAMLADAGTTVNALMEWYASNVDAYPLNRFEDMMLTTVLNSSCKELQELAVVFNNAANAPLDTKTATAARILSDISVVVASAKTVAISTARQSVRDAVDVVQPNTLPEVTTYCETVQTALSTASGLLTQEEYAGLSSETSLRIALMFARTTFDTRNRLSQCLGATFSDDKRLPAHLRIMRGFGALRPDHYDSTAGRSPVRSHAPSCGWPLGAAMCL
jgi:hypothetical protein